QHPASGSSYCLQREELVAVESATTFYIMDNIKHSSRKRKSVSAEPFEEPLILSIEDRVGPNKDDVLGRCMLPLEYVERRLDHKAINTRRFNLEKHVMVVEGEKKKEVKFASKIHMKYINPINGP
ncbi:hypothetical protein Tco_0273978, partial [Tanacetum coccineum]